MDLEYNDFSYEHDDVETDTYGEELTEKEIELADEELFNTIDKIADGLEADVAEYDAYVDAIDLTYYDIGWYPNDQSFSEEGYDTLKTAIQSDMAAIAKAYAKNVHYYAIEYDLKPSVIDKIIKNTEEQISKEVHDAKGDADAPSIITTKWQHGYPSYSVKCTLQVPVKIMKGAIQLNESRMQHLTPFQQQVQKWAEMLG